MFFKLKNKSAIILFLILYFINFLCAMDNSIIPLSKIWKPIPELKYAYCSAICPDGKRSIIAFGMQNKIGIFDYSDKSLKFYIKVEGDVRRLIWNSKGNKLIFSRLFTSETYLKTTASGYSYELGLQSISYNVISFDDFDNPKILNNVESGCIEYAGFIKNDIFLGNLLFDENHEKKLLYLDHKKLGYSVEKADYSQSGNLGLVLFRKEKDYFLGLFDMSNIAEKFFIRLGDIEKSIWPLFIDDEHFLDNEPPYKIYKIQDTQITHISSLTDLEENGSYIFSVSPDGKCVFAAREGSGFLYDLSDKNQPKLTQINLDNRLEILSSSFNDLRTLNIFAETVRGEPVLGNKEYFCIFVEIKDRICS